MENEIVVEGRIFPVDKNRKPQKLDLSDRIDFRKTYGLFPRRLFEYGVIICIPPRGVDRAIARIKGPFMSQTDQEHPWDVFDGRYTFEENENLGILRHEKQKNLCIKLKEPKVEVKTLPEKLSGLYSCESSGQTYALYRIIE